ncbi:tetratricopeptide repeat protein [Rugosimonospora africana]|uniref:Tetratricopeptide repeat protein n=1 Tax=Rugosimonospora africana TaxID=556532 RepID=A0A8J3QZW8_9ACTN|nr:hypothetical protein [Rugosimonospora africana]GIH20415.1 hypothetical protein Raf01_85870 [Rugosimonospora africana]
MLTKLTSTPRGRMRPRIASRPIAVGGALAILLAGVTVGLGAAGRGGPAQSAAAQPAVAPATDQLDVSIAKAQQELRRVPGDYATWAELGSAYVENARITADPSWYPKAEGALRTSLRIQPASGNATALTGMGALANARHDFAGAAGWARQALAVDPYQSGAYGVLTDALTQLGDPAGATAAVQHMLDLAPGLSALTRASYDLEQHGRLADAQTLMAQAMRDATDPSDVAFCRFQLGELAWQDGRLDDAEAQYAAGLAADPIYLPLREGQAKMAAARGQTAQALTEYAQLTQRYPSPTYILEYAELLQAAGQHAQARAQLALADAAQQLFAANGGVDDLTGSAIALAEGHPADAVAAAQREWQRRHFADVADQLAWALHAAGRDAEALGYARQADSLGARNAKYSFHLGTIERALGDDEAAHADLTRALAINPDFDPIDGPVLRGTVVRRGAS